MCPSSLSALLFVSLSSTLLVVFSGNIMNEVSFTVVDVYTQNGSLPGFQLSEAFPSSFVK